MNKLILLFTFLLFGALSLNAQTIEELKSMQAEKSAMAGDLSGQLGAIQGEIDAIQKEIDLLSGWRTGLTGLIGFDLNKSNGWASSPNPNASSSALNIGLTGVANMNKLVAKYKDNDEIMFIALTDESIEKVSAFLMKMPFNFTHIPNAKSLTDALQTRMVKTYPQHLVLNKESKIVFQESGEISNVDQVLSQVIEQLR